MAKSKLKATVFIPTYNGEKYLPQILQSIYSQETDFDYETLIIDSGSSDRTLEIIKDFQGRHHDLRLHQIPNSEFGHGKTRNLAAQMAHGEIMVYLSHDAIPAHARWLHEMVKPFEISDKVVGVMGKQIPRIHCIPMLKSEIRGVFAGFGPDFGTTIYYKDDFVQDQGVMDVLSFYSDVNSAARRTFLLDTIPYKDVRYSEDMLFGKDIINAGYYKVYAPRGSVVHSNDLTLREYKHRMFDETLGLRKIGQTVTTPSVGTMTKLIVRGVVRDTRNILRDPEYSWKRKLYWLVVNPCFHIEKWRGVRVASKTALDNQQLQKVYSLEKRKARS